MRRDEALRRLRAAQPRWDELGVARLSLFGSVARDEARPDSDVDLLVEYVDPHGYSLLDLFGLQDELEAVLGTKVDLGTVKTLRPELRDDVLREAVIVS